MKKPYTKPGKDPKELLAALKSKGLIIEDDSKATQYIQNIGYFRLKAYFYPLYQEPKQDHLFKPQSTFGQALSMYRFDRKLRLLLFNEIEKIEVALRSAIVNIVTKELNDVFWMTRPEYFKNEDCRDFAFRKSQLHIFQPQKRASKEACCQVFRSPGPRPVLVDSCA